MTNYAKIGVIDNFSKALDRNDTWGIFLDLYKPFDTWDCEKLLMVWSPLTWTDTNKPVKATRSPHNLHSFTVSIVSFPDRQL